LRGSPVREFLLFVLLAGALLIPLSRLATPDAAADSGHGPALDRNGDAIPTWLNLRFSHPVLSLRLSRDGEEVYADEGELRGISFESVLPGKGAEFVLEVFWPIGIEGSPYAELSLEPDERREIVRGLWGKPGHQTHRWFVDPEAP